MGAWLKGLLVALLAFGLCWGGAIGYWRSTNRMPSSADLVIWMLAVPLGLLAIYVIGRKVMTARAAAAAAAPVPVAAAGPDAPAAPSGPGPALAVVATAVRTPHGQAADELAKAIDEDKARAELDPELVNDEGYPIMSARVAEAIDDGMREEIAAWFTAHGVADPDLSDEQWRALGMATGVVAELAQQATAHPHAQAQDGMPPAPMLQLSLLPGANWSEVQRSAAGDWLRQVATDAGWPAARIATGAAAPAKLGDGAAAASAALTRLTALAAANTAPNTSPNAAPLLAILLAFDSQIGEASVDRLAAGNRLFGANRPQGCIPGEGAAGLLLADPATAKLMEVEAPVIHALSAARDGSADSARRPDAATLRTLLAHAATQGGVEPAKVAMVVADTDHRTSRVMELMALATEGLPHLDAGADVKASGTVCGACGAVPSLSALALACHHAGELAAPVLCVSNEDPHHRGVVLVRPAALQS